MWPSHSLSVTIFLGPSCIETFPVFPCCVSPNGIIWVVPAVGEWTRPVVRRRVVPGVMTTYVSLAIPACAETIVRTASRGIGKDGMCSDYQTIPLCFDSMRVCIVRNTVAVWMIKLYKLIETGLRVGRSVLDSEYLVGCRTMMSFRRTRPDMLFF